MSTVAERKQKILENAAEIKKLKAQLEEVRPIKTLIHTLENFSTDVPVKLLNLSCKKMLSGHFAKIYAMDWGADDTKLISAAQDGSIILWNALNGYKLAVIDLSCAWVMSCAMSDSGRLTASGGLDNLVTIYKLPDYSSDDVKTDKLKHHKQLADHEGYISAAVFLDDQRVVSSSGDNKCIVWDVETGKALNVFSEHIADVQDVDKIPNTDLIVSGSIDKKCRVWDIRQDSKTKALAFAGHEGDVNAVSALHNGNSFVSGSDDASCMLFDIRSYGPLQAYGKRNIVSTISSVGVSSSGRYIFAGYDDYNCRVWDTLRGTMAISENVNNLKLHTNRVSCLGVNSAGTALCTGSWDLTLRVFA